MRLLLSLLLMAPAPALACGGFFCDALEPVDQAGEQIVFALDRDAGAVEMHVQIAYVGEAADFAWVLPVPANPELFVSTEALFTGLEAVTRPRFELTYEVEGRCKQRISPPGRLTIAKDDAAAEADPPSDEEDTDVTVVAEARVGPYETVTLQATDSGALLDWLQARGFDLPDDLGPAMDPYVAGGTFFLALRLAKDADTGDLAPLGLRYEGKDPEIPLQLTRIAATPDMPLRIYVLSDGRAVPDNYLHVQVNEVAVDWFNFGANYWSLITRAADEAGGHAFATDMAGLTTERLSLARPEWAAGLTAIGAADDPAELMAAVTNAGFPGDAETLAVLELCLPMPPGSGVSAQDFFNCPDCYTELWSELAFDAPACALAFDERMIAPRVAADGLLWSHPWLTRLTSSVSPSEMDLDPRFVINPAMAQVEALRTATLVTECRPARFMEDAPRRLELPSGTVVPLPAESWFWEKGLDYPSWVDSAAGRAAWVVEQTSADAAPVLISDHRDEVGRLLQELADNAETEVGGQGARACGCATGGGRWAWAPLLLLALRRRREAR